jgi:hypothetical protein
MAAGDLTDLATAKIAAGVDPGADPVTDGILGSLITALSAYVPQVLDRGILAADYSEIYDGNGGQALLMRQRPVISVASVAWNGFTLTTPGGLSSSGIWTDGRSIRLNGQSFPLGIPVQIAYRAGYAAVPADVSLACAELVAEAYFRRMHVGEMSRSQGGQETVSFDGRTMHAAIADKLSGYRIGAPC